MFDFTYNAHVTDRQEYVREARKYVNTTVTQLYYTSNLVHDCYTATASARHPATSSSTISVAAARATMR